MRRKIQRIRESKKSEKKFNLIIVIRIISVIVILLCIGMIIYRFFNLKNSKKIIEDINSDVKIDDKTIEVNGVTANLIDTDISSLKKKNNDTIAWIKVNGTNVNYPVVKSTNNDYYLKHSFDNSYSQAGWIFMDYRNNIINFDDNTIIYGHNMLNQTMFSSLTNMLNESFFKTDDNNRYIYLTTENSSTLWKIFSIYVTNPETYYMNIDFSSKSDFSNFLNTIKSRSMYNLNEDVTANDKILTLSTCTNLNTKRLVVHAKLIYQENK